MWMTRRVWAMFPCGWLQDGEFVVGLFDELLLVFWVWEDTRVLGQVDDLIGAEAADQKRVKDDLGAEAFEAML